MKIYAIAKSERKCYGHGDFQDEETICKHGPYGSLGFHPVFTSIEAANEYLNSTNHISRLIVVELELVTDSRTPE